MNLIELLEQIGGFIYRGFMGAINSVTDDAILAQLTKAIEDGDFDTVWRILAVSQAAMRPLTKALDESFEQGAQWVASSYPKIINTPDGKGRFRFNILNPRAQEWLRNESSQLVTGIVEESRTAVRSTLDDGMANGRNPRMVALDIVGRYDKGEGRRVGGVVGLTSDQEAWSRSVRNRLNMVASNPDEAKRYFDMKLRDARFDSVVRKAIESGKPLTQEQVESLVTRYKDRALKHRGDTIARTESISSLSAARYESTQQVIESGAAREKDVKRVWDATNDDRTRFTHSEMEGQSVGLNEPYVSPSGARLMHPHDRSLGAPASEVIGCRCTERIEIDWIGAALDD